MLLQSSSVMETWMKRWLLPYHLPAIQLKLQQPNHVPETVDGVYVGSPMCGYSDKGQIDSPLKANNSLRKCTVKHAFLVKKYKNTFGAF